MILNYNRVGQEELFNVMRDGHCSLQFMLKNFTDRDVVKHIDAVWNNIDIYSKFDVFYGETKLCRETQKRLSSSDLKKMARNTRDTFYSYC